MNRKTRSLALTQGVIAGTLFGTAAILIRLVGSVDPIAIAFWRLAVAAIAIYIIAAILRLTPRFEVVRANLGRLVILGLLTGLHFIFFVSAVIDTTILNATVLVNTSPILATAISSAVYGLKPTRKGLFGLFISFFGVYTLTSSDLSNFSGSNLKGDIEALLAAFAEAVYLNYGRSIRMKLPLLTLMMPVFIAGAGLLFLFSISSGVSLTSIPGSEQTVFLIALGLIPTAIGHTAYTSSLSGLRSYETATMALLEPIGATTLGVVIFGEVPGQTFLFGGALVLLGVAIVLRSGASPDSNHSLETNTLKTWILIRYLGVFRKFSLALTPSSERGLKRQTPSFKLIQKSYCMSCISLLCTLREADRFNNGCRT